ncbi:MAG: arginyl-tRNA synthetase [Phycisphaerales bacterium]|jgi:arginyl-tRNA synthetase
MSDPTTTSIDPVEILEARFTDAIAAAFPGVQADPLISGSRNPKLGDFQSNAAMPLGKRAGINPREAAAKIIEHLKIDDLAEPLTEESIAGPGFINIRLKPAALADFLGRLDTPELGIAPPTTPQTVVVDLCGVNLAKQMHVGHLRSTVIGDAVARLFERLGHTVIRQSHVGDWGLPIAMVVQRIIEMEDAGEIDPATLGLDHLNTLYRAAQAECTPEQRALETITKFGGHPKALAECELRVETAREAVSRAKARLVALQSGDDRSVATWKRVYDITMAECLRTTGKLHANIKAEHSAGESTYRAELAPVVADLEARGIAEESDEALVVRVEGIAEPCLIRKRDGGFLYATTDLAALKRRCQQFGASRVVYCVDARQSLHFKQVFGAAHKAGYSTTPTGEVSQLQHAAFGNVMGEDNRPLKTRSGENVKLADLLDEAVERATKTVAEKNPDHTPQEHATIAEAVAITAIKYADLSTERIKDYVFSFDRMLAFEGDTGPYLMYALVRVKSIFRKAAEAGIEFNPAAELLLNEPEEKALALKLLRYPRVVRASGENLEPHRLCNELYELASAFSTFFDRCPVLRAPDAATRDSRLRLAGLTARALADGLDTLGLPTVERM